MSYISENVQNAEAEAEDDDDEGITTAFFMANRKKARRGIRKNIHMTRSIYINIASDDIFVNQFAFLWIKH